jgi:hypothetical protein
MLRDFRNDADIHPVLRLPGKEPQTRNERWSRQSGCYQLKAALAWLELAEGTGNSEFREAFERTLEQSMATQANFLTGEGEGERLVDRLHAYGYFLEALTAMGRERREELNDGIARAAVWLRRLRPKFDRSDASAQLLRVRLHAEAHAGVALDKEAAREEAVFCAAYQDVGPDPRCTGGFWFGSLAGARVANVNPVSTAFCVQALAQWEQREGGESAVLDWHELI